MKSDLKKYTTVFCAALIFVFAAGTAPFAARALAVQTVPEQTTQQTTDGSGNVTPPDSTSNGSSAGSGTGSVGSSQPNGAGSSGTAGSGGSSGASRESSATESGQITVVFNLNGGTGMKTSAKLDKGTSVSQLKTPTKTGYRFVGWSQGGVILPDSKSLNRDTVLTANWRKVQSESADSVDTRQNEVDAAASAAKEAISEPDVLSSQDWNSILSASSAQSSASSAVSSRSVSSSAQSSGGFSTLLAAGIALILLGVVGVVAFIYLQFIRKPPRGGPHGGSGGGRRGAEDDTLTFTDVSSYSSGKKPDDASAILYPQSASNRQTPNRFQRAAAGGYRPGNRVSAGEGDFDWRRFFESGKE